MSEKLDKLNAELKSIETITNRLSNTQLVIAIIQLAFAVMGWFSSTKYFSTIAAIMLVVWLVVFMAFLVGWFLHNRKFDQVMRAMDEDFNDYLTKKLMKINAARPAGALPENSNGSEIEVPKASIQ